MLLPGKRLLKHGDEIKICDFLFVFQDKVAFATEDSSSVSSIDKSVAHSDSSVYLAQPTEILQLLLEITNRLSHSLDLDTLLPQVVEALLQLFKQADRGFLILVDKDTGELDASVFKTRQPAREAQCRFSASIVKHCVRTVNGLLSSNPGQLFPESGSIPELALRSVICAPLWSEGGQAFGALLLDTHSAKRRFTEDDLNLLMGVANQVSVVLANAQYHRDAIIWEGHKRDLALAREVVKSFLPERLPSIPGYEFFASYESALEVGGDYYDFVPLGDLGDQRLAILVGDVTGKGVAAAIAMVRFSAEARACLRTEPQLDAAVRKLNTLMEPLSHTDRFITLAVVALDPTSHRVELVNAGHPAPLLLRRVDGAVGELGPRADAGPPLGVVPGFEYRSHQFVLEPGDRVILFSDGITEAMNAQGRQLGVRGLRAAIEAAAGSTPRQLGEHILHTVEQHTAGCNQHDDTTLVCFGPTDQ